MSMWLSLGMLLPGIQIFVVFLLAVFYGGVVSTLHKKHGGEKVWLGDFFNGFKSLPRFLSLFMVGFPAVLFGVFSGAVLANSLGPDMLQSLAQASQPPSKELVDTIGPILLMVLLKLLPLGVLISWIIFLAVPRAMLDKRLGLLALWDAVRAIFTNIGALVVFSACIMIAALAVSFLLGIFLSLMTAASAVAGSFLQTIVLIFISTLGSALYFNAMYIAWRDIFMSDTIAPISEIKDLPETQIEV